MKAYVNNQTQNFRTDNRLLELILELQALLDQYQQEGNPYDQVRTSDIQSAIQALDVISIRILTETWFDRITRWVSINVCRVRGCRGFPLPTEAKKGTKNPTQTSRRSGSWRMLGLSGERPKKRNPLNQRKIRVFLIIKIPQWQHPIGKQ